MAASDRAGAPLQGSRPPRGRPRHLSVALPPGALPTVQFMSVASKGCHYTALDPRAHRYTHRALRMKTVGKLLNCFLLLHLKYENKSENSKAEHENERELMKYREFQKQTNSSGFMSNTVDIRKLNTEYRPVGPSA